jgi:DNA-directed RNA polymerase subunit RPC12/RpoP
MNSDRWFVACERCSWKDIRIQEPEAPCPSCDYRVVAKKLLASKTRLVAVDRSQDR